MQSPLETGMEPEFFVTHIAKHEVLHGGMVRLYLTAERMPRGRVEYTVVCTIAALAEMVESAAQIVASCESIAPIIAQIAAH